MNSPTNGTFGGLGMRDFDTIMNDVEQNGAGTQPGFGSSESAAPWPRSRGKPSSCSISPIRLKNRSSSSFMKPTFATAPFSARC